MTLMRKRAMVLRSMATVMAMVTATAMAMAAVDLATTRYRCLLNLGRQ